jgi:hypothetical protein
MTAVNEVTGNKDSKIAIKIMKKNNQPTVSVGKNQKAIVPRIIVVGTGLHRQVLGHDGSPLSSWSKFLETANKEFQVDETLPALSDPVMQWEQMLCNTAKPCDQGNGQLNASAEEKKLKKSVCNSLKEISLEMYQSGIYDNNFLADKITNSSIHLLSLNFDSLAYTKLKPKKQTIADGKSAWFDLAAKEGVRKSDVKLLYDRFICKNQNNHSTVWHPHGHLSRNESLVLGMRDYGFLPPSYFYAFNQFKKWERKISGDSHGIEKHQKLLQALASFDEKNETEAITHSADHWVTRFMLYPLTFVGVGLSKVEIGMRWLLVQRSRNFRNMPDNQKPVTEFYGPENPEIPGLSWKGDKSDFAQMWKSALGS